MKTTEYIQTMLSSYNDPKMIANAFEEYYKRMYDRSLEFVDSLLNYNLPNTDANLNRRDLLKKRSEEKSRLVVKSDDAESNEIIPDVMWEDMTDDDKADLVTITNDLNNQFLVSKHELESIFGQYNEMRELDLIEFNDYEVTLTNLASGEPDIIKIGLTDVAEGLGNTIDSCFLTWQGFKAVSSDTIEAAQNFFNSVNLKVNQTSSVITNTASSIYSVLANVGSKITDKLQGMVNFVGITAANTDVNAAVRGENIDLANYTGVNPLLGWLNGVDWDKFKRSLVSSPISFIICCRKMMDNIIKTVFNGLINLGTKLFSWLGSKIKTTFVNPIDYSCSEPVLKCWNAPAKYKVELDLEYDLDRNAASSLKDIGGDSEFWFCEGPSYFRILPLPDMTSQKVPIYIERYTKPIDYKKLYAVLSQFMTYDNGSIVPISGGTTFTYREILSIFQSLATADLSCDNKVKESLVFYNTEISHSWTMMMNQFKFSLLHLMTLNDNHFRVFNSNWLEDIDLDNFVSYPYYIQQPMLDLRDDLINLYGVIGCWVGAFTGSSHQWNLNRSDRVSNSTNPESATITNADFISEITLFPYWPFVSQDNRDIAYTGLNTLGVLSAYMDDGYMDIGKWCKGYLSSQSVVNLCSLALPIFTDAFITYACRNLQAGTAYDGAYICYYRGSFPVDTNIDVVSDATNISAVGSFLKGAAIAAAVVASAVVAGRVIASLVTKYRQATWTKDTIAFNYGDALSKGDVATANALYRQYKGYNLQSKMLGLAFGRSTSMAGAKVSDIFDNFGVSQYSNENIVQLIVPQS